MNGRFLTVTLLVAVSVLFVVPSASVCFVYFCADEHFGYSVIGGVMLLAALIVSWRRFHLR